MDTVPKPCPRLKKAYDWLTLCRAHKPAGQGQKCSLYQVDQVCMQQAAAEPFNFQIKALRTQLREVRPVSFLHIRDTEYVHSVISPQIFDLIPAFKVYYRFFQRNRTTGFFPDTFMSSIRTTQVNIATIMKDKAKHHRQVISTAYAYEESHLTTSTN